ncbi:MAG: hypothetical protein ACLRQ8_10255 [Coprococcus sp.]
MRFVTIFLFIVGYKFLSNLLHCLRIRKLHQYFCEFMKQQRDNMNLYRQEVLSLFEKAHIKDVKIPVSERIGNSQIANWTASTFSMFPSLRPAFSSTALNMFEEAEGVFRKNMIDSINPFYWIDLIIFLPKTLLSYLGISSETSTYKICNVLLTFIWWVFEVFLIYYKPQLQQFLVELVRNI